MAEDESTEEPEESEESIEPGDTVIELVMDGDELVPVIYTAGEDGRPAEGEADD